MLTVSIKLDDREVVNKINTLTSNISSFRQPFEKVGNDLLDLYGKKVFDTQGREIGDSWKPLSVATLQLRASRRGYYAKQPRTTNKILIWTGRLQDGFRKIVTSHRLVIENLVEYFKYHQLSQRKMLRITKKVIEIVEKRILEHITKGL